MAAGLWQELDQAQWQLLFDNLSENLRLPNKPELPELDRSAPIFDLSFWGHTGEAARMEPKETSAT